MTQGSTGRREASPAVASILTMALSSLLLSVALLLATMSRTSVQSAIIAGDSMAPALLGPHYEVQCRRCGFLIVAGLEHPPDRQMVFCPNCGQRENRVTDEHLRPGDAVRVVPLLHAGPIERGDCLAFRSPEDHTLVVKRVMALPGERPAIVRGDCYVNGQPVAKSLAHLREVALPVYDGSRLPYDHLSNSPRWKLTSGGPFSAHAPGFLGIVGSMQFDPGSIAAVDIPAATKPSESTAILDLDAHNQSLARPLNPVTDLLLSGYVECRPDCHGTILMQFPSGEELRLMLTSHQAKFMQRLANQEVLLRIESNEPFGFQPFTLAVCNGQWLLEFAGRRHRLPMLTETPQEGSPLVRITGTDMGLHSLKLRRDVYYLHPNGSNMAWELGRSLGVDEYFVLGDNSPASTDSRHWQQGIRRSAIVGKVFPVNK